MAGEQYSTITKDTRNLVKAVPALLLPPQIVTKENAAESYADDAACAGPHGSITRGSRGSWGRPGTLTPKSLDVE